MVTLVSGEQKSTSLTILEQASELKKNSHEAMIQVRLAIFLLSNTDIVFKNQLHL